MYRHNLSRTGSAGSNDALPRGELKWAFEAGDVIGSSPVVANGAVYIGSRDSKIYAIDVETGTERWSYETESWVEGSAAVANGMVYIGSRDGSMYALDAETGALRWKYRKGKWLQSSPAVADGRVYYGTGDYQVLALDADTGTELWSFETDGIVISSPAVAKGIVFINSQEFVYALDAATGRLRLNFMAFGKPGGSPIVDGESFYVLNSQGGFYSADVMARSWPAEHWTRNLLLKIYIQSFEVVPPIWLIPPRQSGFQWGMNINSATYSTPALVDDKLYVTLGTKLVLVSLTDRERKWEYATGDRIRSSPAVTGEGVFIGSTDGNVYGVNSATGEELWIFPTGGTITSSPVVVDGVLYIGSHDGKLYAIE
jgi:outer membrane protein assembly factor BamB